MFVSKLLQEKIGTDPKTSCYFDPIPLWINHVAWLFYSWAPLWVTILNMNSVFLSSVKRNAACCSLVEFECIKLFIIFVLLSWQAKSWYILITVNIVGFWWLADFHMPLTFISIYLFHFRVLFEKIKRIIRNPTRENGHVNRFMDNLCRGDFVIQCQLKLRSSIDLRRPPSKQRDSAQWRRRGFQNHKR